MKQEENPNIIIDIGSHYTKAGLGSEEGPRSVFPTCIGYPRNPNDLGGLNKKNFLIGSDAEAKRNLLKINYPIEYGYVNDWDDMEKIYEYIFTEELRINPKEHYILLTNNLMDPKEYNEKKAQIMLETFKVPGFIFATEQILDLYSYGALNGIVIDSGEYFTYTIPFIESHYLKDAGIRVDLGGRNLTKYMWKNQPVKKEFAKTIKEKACYVAYDFEKELTSVKPFDYELPDNTKIILKEQRIICPEALFKPYMVGKEGKGIAQTCVDSIKKCDENIRKVLYNNIFLCGGNSFFQGLPERLAKEIKALVPEYMKKEVKVNASPERKYSAWIGGSILSSIPNFKSNWVTKAEYEESGVSIIQKKSF